ncbi:Zinc carboxypeptidase [Lacunisphaera limnophila]|uniref:Zinc carboxypeptidase n=1 Tax=Lacunisphaera limnophila TaxID=1838286 RepID=A0A1D8AUG2_9BACT|nr:M14 family metallopeptidase [Lacunisphaera limnophila]AOS44529.1 Zinc carboxypeptidase [Lacunisphaera limnophila]
MSPCRLNAPALLLCLLLPLTRAEDPQAFLPPVLPWQGASEALIAPPDHPWITPSERTGLTDSPDYDETLAWLQKLCAATPLLHLQEFGRTAAGRPLYVVLASQEGASTVATLAANGRPTLLAQAGIHSGEIDGKDAGLMLLRDLAFGGKATLLAHANFVLVPVFNADGHEHRSAWNRPNQRGPVHQGWRTTAQNLNLNRDYMKADAPEMQAMIGLLRAADPALYLDLHVTDGLDHQYDITYAFEGWGEGAPAYSPGIAAWLNRRFRPATDTALVQGGHIPGPYYEPVNGREPSGGISIGNGAPRFSTGYGDLRHLPAVLLETHSLKPYRQRVLGTYVFLESALRALGEHGPELQAAIAADRATRPEQVPVNWTDADPTTAMDVLGVAYEEYVSPASGAKEIRWLGRPQLLPGVPVRGSKAGLFLARPRAYWVPVTKPEVIARLKLHGIGFETLTEARTVSLEMCRLTGAKPQPSGGFHVFETRYTLRTDVRRETRTETFPAGSVRVPTDQPLGDLAIVLLEPAAHDSLLAWGFFNEILQRTEYIEGYVIAPLAEQMLADDPALKAEFEAKLAAEPAFAQNPAARLQWFYERTKFQDDRYLLYPVGIER